LSVLHAQVATTRAGIRTYWANVMTFHFRISPLRHPLLRAPGDFVLPVWVLVVITLLTFPGGTCVPSLTVDLFAQQKENSEQNYYAKAHPYLDLSADQLIARIPELKTIQPASDQGPLPTILQKTSEQVDQYIHNFVDVSARELISAHRNSPQSQAVSRFELEDRYLILHRSTDKSEGLIEYRMDSEGNRDERSNPSGGYFLTASSAMNLTYFSGKSQTASRFRFLGEQSIGSRAAYVVVFTQKPGDTIPAIGSDVHEGHTANTQVNLLMQGIAWVDKATFQILKLRTDLLAPRPEIGMDRLTSIVTFGEVQLPDVSATSLLPINVQVTADFNAPGRTTGFSQTNFHNEYRYSDYKRYNLSAKPLPEVAKEIANAPSTASKLEKEKLDEKNEILYYNGIRPYAEKSLPDLANGILELKGIRPPADSQQLPLILKKTGENVDEFFFQIVDLISQESVTQSILDDKGEVTATENLVDSYLILRQPMGHNNLLHEYRMDPTGNSKGRFGLERGFLLSRGFALSCVYFSTALQPESDFRYLGDQKVGELDTYVLSFAQKPGDTTLHVTTTTGNALHNTSVDALIQGLVWIDKSNYQIVRMRTDLLAPRPETGLDEDTTIVTFSKMELPDAKAPLWLPKDVSVTVKYTVSDKEGGVPRKVSYRNEHHYSDYKSYRVSVKMVPSGETGSPASLSATSTSPAAPAPAVPAPAVPAKVKFESNPEVLYYAGTHPYFEKPLDALAKDIPDLKGIQPAANSQLLPEILRKTAGNVDDFFRQIVDLIAQEKIKQVRYNRNGMVSGSESVHDSYLILRHTQGNNSDFDEYRMDPAGNRIEDLGLNKGFLLTTGFALTCNYFSTEFQQESTFRYLGDQRMDARDTYVISFAQKPGQTTLYLTTTTMNGQHATSANALVQGIAWVDKSNFQIVRIRTDLLAARPEIGLDSHSTTVSLAKVELQDSPSVLWLPVDVKVNLKFVEFDSEHGKFYVVSYQNEHHYTDYRRYHVSVKMKTPE
jgi:hypothetical protein